MSSPRKIWDLVSKPHSCDFYKEIIIDIPAEFADIQDHCERPDANFTSILPYTPDQVATRARAACPLFSWLIEKEQADKERIEQGHAIRSQLLHFYYNRVYCEEWESYQHSGSFLERELLADADDKVGTLLTPNLPIERDVLSESACSTMRSWLSRCIASHEDCQPDKTQFLPTRLINVGSHSTPKLKLCEVMIGSEIQWCALSHCWGGDQPVKTTRSTYRDKICGIDLEELPPTIRDAVTVARSLHIPYLWIDCLCIIQDDPDDMACEIAMLPQIFRLAQVTISVASASASGSGFLQRRSVQSEQQPFVLRCRDSEGQMGKIILVKGAFPEDFSEPIDSRAWTYQEAFLAARLLRFTSTQIQWSCGRERSVIGGCFLTYVTELYKPPRTRITPYTSLNWGDVVMAYCHRDLDFEQDKLVAISALAAQYATTGKGRYLAGLWESDLPHGLLWTTISVGKRPCNWRAPSWSWASTQNKVVTNEESALHERTNAMLLDVKVALETSQLIYGTIKSANIHLKCKLLEASIPTDDMPTHVHLQSYLELPPYRNICDDASKHCRFCRDDEELFDSTPRGAQLYCAKISECRDGDSPLTQLGLVLRQAEEYGKGAYLRVGTFYHRCEDCNENPFERVEYQMIDLY